MKRLTTSALALLCGLLLVFAADYAALRRAADATQASVTSPSAPCNRGEGETFAEFLVKFTVDPTFNSSRSKISSVFAIKPIADYRALVVTQGHEAGYTQMWKEIGADAVSLYCGFEGAPADFHYLFKRVGGKWMLVDRIVDDF